MSALAFAGHNYIGTEHILLGLLREGEGVAARVLETVGADPTKIRSQVQLADILTLDASRGFEIGVFSISLLLLLTARLLLVAHAL